MCFEILGFDFIFDENLKVYLLEVNHAPSFNSDTPFDLLNKSTLIYETLKVVGISIKNRKKLIKY